ncbi:MAG: SGNH/GDSL hydrolase family protein [Victivallaceae bacterium]|jgi:lysophospholipase L1-like esterase|nr:SGNH/GDSL hydrolase family protein [Victivallaceae bacterium]NLK83515.1 SGNH/GDSL hydrolase family protein [Lentisphaerota bacterium]MDD3116584.1 SGNH/GDSL hydrolase family protein [Victivallaceae bacterium]MDD3703741.1 SGNH/GDSL hydrolase family protein [Victivallaceae bacterium]MDD4317988.1 SGNH/GDSL hydrolase family protein [Victivallaceae bacterium]
MNINLVENIELVHGAAEVCAGEDGFSLARMTEELLTFYSFSEAQEIRASCPSGVRICFNSNTSFVAMRISYGRLARAIFAVELVVDGTEVLTFAPETPENGLTFTTELPAGGERRIEIFLPHLCECQVNELIIEDGATLTPVKYPGKRIIFIGDSITQGMTSSSPLKSYTSRLAAKLDWDFHNISVGGAIMKQEVGRMAEKIKWDLAILAYGVNDFAQSRPLDEFIADTVGMLRYLCQRKKSVVWLITPIPCPAVPPVNTQGLKIDDYRKALTDAATEFDNVRVVDGTELVPDDKKYFDDDGVHPNDLGMASYADVMFKKMS